MTRPKSTEETKKRHTYFITPTLVRKVKYITVQEGGSEASHVEKAIQDYVSKWEKKNGIIPLKS
jgi:hypothetical protein